MKAVNTLLYLRGERTLEDLRLERMEVVRARKAGNRHVLDNRDLSFLDLVYGNPDLLKLNWTKLSSRTGVPASTLFERWKRLLAKDVRPVIRIQPIKDQGGSGEDLKALSSPSEVSEGFRKSFPLEGAGPRTPSS